MKKNKATRKALSNPRNKTIAETINSLCTALEMEGREAKRNYKNRNKRQPLCKFDGGAGAVYHKYRKLMQHVHYVREMLNTKLEGCNMQLISDYDAEFLQRSLKKLGFEPRLVVYYVSWFEENENID